MIYQWIIRERFRLLFFSILIFLTVPAFITSGIYEIITMAALSFIFIQCIWVFTARRKHIVVSTVVVMLIIVLTLFITFQDEVPKGLMITRNVVYILFFGFVLISLFKALLNSKKVTGDIIYTGISIYMIMGIIGGAMAFLLQLIYDRQAFKLPDTIQHSDLLDFTYFGFVTMSTLGYGDITPIRQEAQALSYLLAIFGQLYVAIIVAIIVSKYISEKEPRKRS